MMSEEVTASEVSMDTRVIVTLSFESGWITSALGNMSATMVMFSVVKQVWTVKTKKEDFCETRC